MALKGHLEHYQADADSITAVDSVGTQEGKTVHPLTGAWFRMEQGPEVTPPKYQYNEIGIMIDGTY